MNIRVSLMGQMVKILHVNRKNPLCLLTMTKTE